MLPKSVMVTIRERDELLLIDLDRELEDLSWYTGPTRTPPPPISLDHRFDLQLLDGVALDDPVSIELSFDKALVHRLLAAEGLRVPEHLELDAGSPAGANAFLAGGRCVVKPASALFTRYCSGGRTPPGASDGK